MQLFRRAGDHRQELGAVAFQLFRADPTDARHLVQRGGPLFGHLDQGAVVEDDIGGNRGRLGQGAALGLERRQQRRVLVRHQRLDRRSAGGGFRQHVLAQPDLGLAAQDRPRGLGHAQGAMAFGIGAHQVMAHHLPEHRLPLAAVIFGADAKGRQFVMAAGADLVGLGAGQDVDQVAGPEIFPGAQDRRQRLAHRGGAVEQLGRGVAQVAMAAGRRLFAEIGQQGLAAAIQRLGQAQQGIQPAVIGGAAFRWRQPLVDLRPAQADVVGAVQRERFRRAAIAPGAADLLVIGLDAFGQVGMGNPADVGLVHAHAEGDGGDHDQPVFALKAGFDDAPVLGLHAAVIMAGGVALVAQRLGQGFGLGAGAAIDDAGLAAAGGGKGEDLLARVVLGGEGKVDIGPVKAVQKGVGRGAVEQFLDDLGLGFGIGSGGEGGQRHVQRAPQFADAQVIGAEIMAPLADAMGLVHGDQADACAGQHVHRPRRG